MPKIQHISCIETVVLQCIYTMKADGEYTIHMITFYGYVFMYYEITTFFLEIKRKNE